MYQVISNESKIIDTKTAIKMLGFNTYKYQRPIKSIHVNDLARKMSDGEYTGGSVVFGMLNGKKYLVDGQHTLNAVVISETPVAAIVKGVKCDTEKDLTLLWQQFDGGVPRSINDFVRSEIGTLGVNWKARAGALIAGAATVATYGPRRNQITKAEKTELISSFIIEGNFVNDMLEGETQSLAQHLRRQPVVAVMMLSHRKSPSDAKVFWNQVKTGEMINKKYPSYHLRAFLLTSAVKGVALSRIASPREFYVRAAKAWNAFRDNKEMRMLKYSIEEQIPDIK